MKKSKTLLVLSLSLACLPAGRPGYADESFGHAGLFANAKEVFRPLLADPRELQLALRMTTPVSRTNLGDIAVGDYFGLYRWPSLGRILMCNGASAAECSRVLTWSRWKKLS